MGEITDKNMKSKAVRDTLVGVIVVLAAIASVILYRYAANKRLEREEADMDAGRIVTTDSGEMEIQTRFYSLHCPDSWKDRIAVECFPAEEEFLGDYSDRELLGNDIDPENYTLRIQYLGEKEEYRVAYLVMAGFLEDFQDYKNWTYAGDIWMDRREGQYLTHLLLFYPEETKEMKSDPVYQQIRRELPGVVHDLVPRTTFLRKEDQSISFSWRPNPDTGDHGSTWKEYYEEKWRLYEEEREKEAAEKDGEKNGSNGSGYGRSSRSIRRYGGTGNSQPDPYDRDDYDDPDDFADDWADEFNEYGDEDEGWEAAHDYWEGDD